MKVSVQTSSLYKVIFTYSYIVHTGNEVTHTSNKQHIPGNYSDIPLKAVLGREIRATKLNLKKY